MLKILLTVACAVALAWILTHSPLLRIKPKGQFRRSEFILPFLFLVLGLFSVVDGIHRMQTGEVGMFKGAGPVSGFQLTVFGAAFIATSIVSAWSSWVSKK